MAGKITVNPNELEEAAAFLRQSAEEYDSIAKKLMNAATTMGSAYESDDNKAFVTQIEGCADDLKKMVVKVRQQAEVLDKQAKAFEETTAANVTAVKNLVN